MDEKEMMLVLTRRLASAELDDRHIEGLAKMVSNIEHKAIGIDICKFGICLDLMIDGDLAKFDFERVKELSPGRLRGIEIFPWGIIDPEIWQVRIGQEF